jgi:hypothetical protein
MGSKSARSEAPTWTALAACAHATRTPPRAWGIRAPTERGSEIPRGTLGWGCRRYARGRLQAYAVHRHAASKGFAVTFRQPSAGNVRASGAASTLQRSRGIPHTRHPSICTSVPPDPMLSWHTSCRRRRRETAQGSTGLQAGEPPKQPTHAGRNRCEPERGNESEKPVIPASAPSEEGPDNSTDNGTDSEETK